MDRKTNIPKLVAPKESHEKVRACRRSKSLSDLRKTSALSLYKPGTKRSAATSSNPIIKEKIAKTAAIKNLPVNKPAHKMTNPSKPAPYDYKSRYNLLLEKHTDLRKKNSENNQKLKEMMSECEELRIRVEKLVDIEQKHNMLKTENERKSYELEKSMLETKHAKGIITELTSTIDMHRKEAVRHEQLRRHLHNRIQDLMGNIRVFCRIRPPLIGENDRSLCNITYLDEVTLEIKQPKESISSQFNFDKVFATDSSQEDVFEDLAQLVQSALDGYHVCVFAYGQTGSGKTFTMQGGSTKDELGMTPRTIKLLFESIQTKKCAGWSYKIEASFMEIYNERIKDLLSPHDKKHHEIRFNEGKGVTVSNLKVVPVSSSNEFSQVIETAHKNRAVASTNYNEHSSRSHGLTKIFIEGSNEISNAIYIGSLNLVDLAGSESAKTSYVERMTETKNINKSLSALGNVMLALHNKDSHVPYRDSKLTYVLQSCLGGNSKTLMFVNISPFEECYKESINSLRFAAKVKEVKTNTRKNKVFKPLSSVQL